MCDLAVLKFSTLGPAAVGKKSLLKMLFTDVEGSDDYSQKPLSLMLAPCHYESQYSTGLDSQCQPKLRYRHAETGSREFLFCVPEDAVPNKVAALSDAQLAILVVDAERGIQVQTRQDAVLSSLLGVPRLAVVVNKLDLIGYDAKSYFALVNQFQQFARRLEIHEIVFFPVAVLHKDNITQRTDAMPWYHGPTLLHYLENVYTEADQNLVDVRLPIDFVPKNVSCSYEGRLLSGILRIGDEVTLLPDGVATRVNRLFIEDSDNENFKELSEAFAPVKLRIEIDDRIELSPGSMLARSQNLPKVVQNADLLVIWMSETPMNPDLLYLVQHLNTETKIRVEEILYRMDVSNLRRVPAKALTKNEIGRISGVFLEPLMMDSAKRNRFLGRCFILEPTTREMVAMAMLIERESVGDSSAISSVEVAKIRNLTRVESAISLKEREEKRNYSACTFWFTGLSGSGKSTLAKALERQLFEKGLPVIHLDGDNIRQGLNKDLGFSPAERRENIRRVAEVAALLNQGGVVVLSTFISPYQRSRDLAREIIGEKQFIEVFVDTPLEECESRDPKGLYKKARQGEITEFTGISAPYEPPISPDIRVKTKTETVQQSVEQLYNRVYSLLVNEA